MTDTTSACNKHTVSLLDILTDLRFDCLVDSVETSCNLPHNELAEILAGDTSKVRSADNIEFEIKTVCDSDNCIRHGQLNIANLGIREVELKNIAQTFSISTKCAAVQALTNIWCRESQAVSIDVDNAPAVIQARGRSCQGYVPYLRVDLSESDCLTLNLIPCGDWRISAGKNETKDTLEITLDRPDECIIQLKPGEVCSVGLDWLVQICNKDDISIAGCHVQRYALEHLDRRNADAVLPVVYNSWFDRFHKISPESLEIQLDTAAQVGCEVFVVDAGWYGDPKLGDWASVGDWSERPTVFAKSTLSDFADLVRSKGMDFGIWMEPERVNANAPVRISHPDWFFDADSKGFCYPDFMNPEARNWVFSEICRVVETYGVKWLKVDCNFDFSHDPHKLGHQSRLQVWHGILDEISNNYPSLVVEGCSSGGLRNDLLATSYFYTNFLSDTVDPVDTIRIGMSGLSRLAPRKTSKWVVLYPTGNGWTPYGNDGLDTGDLVLCPATATADKVSSYHIDFALRAGMTGVMGIAGNIAGLDSKMRGLLAEYVAFYKDNREFIQNSIAIPLTPIEPLDNRRGISVIQLSDRNFKRSMLFVYNIDSESSKVVVKPQCIDASVPHKVECTDGCKIECPENLQSGFEVECPHGHAKIIIIEPAS
ncbi:MAG: glycoside hydrolase family 36 protein [Armatimonadota bacterium]